MFWTKNSLNRMRDLDKMCGMLMKDIGEAYGIPSSLVPRCPLVRVNQDDVQSMFHDQTIAIRKDISTTLNEIH